MRKKVCIVDHTEKDEIEMLHERRISLRNLLGRFSDCSSELTCGIDQHDIIRSYQSNAILINNWWSGTLKKYGLPSQQEWVYYIDLSTGEISVTDQITKTVAV